MLDYFSRSIAVRHLRSNLRQNLLTVGVVAISVTLIVFLGALVGGLQQRLIDSVTGAIAHVVIRQPEREPVGAWEVPEGREAEALYVGRVVKLQQRRQKIEDWAGWIPRLERAHPAIVGVAAMTEGPGFLVRAAKRKAVRLVGMIPERYNVILDVQGSLAAGRFFGLNPGEAALGRKLAKEFALQLGDKIRLVSDEGNAQSFTLAGIFESGFTVVDEGTVFVPLKDGQALFALGTAVTTIGLKLADVFQADAVAGRLAPQLPYEVESWMKKNENLLDALRTQKQNTGLILGFSVVAAGFSIAGILITAVMSRMREIGILKAVGATRRQILGIFALEGILVAALGALVGAGLGAWIAILAERWLQAGIVARSGGVFRVDLRPELFAGAIGVAIVVGLLAALYPAWRAARVNPVDVIRGT
ncbi:MAG: ABC transporter permease [Candidatus Rokubacteria bacterium]|nr:ABC transporter permease [Candidatus Rokubacteria bacterium]